MIKFSKISFIILLSLGLSAITLAASNIYDVVNENEKEIVLYPNPVLGNEFSISSNQEISQVTVLNVLGQEVYKQTFVQIKKTKIELDAGNRGVYLVQIQTLDGATTIKRILFK